MAMMGDYRRRVLGTITSVTADRFVVELTAGQDSFTLVGFDAQHYVARIGSFVLIPLQSDYVVAEVVGLRDSDMPDRDRFHSDITDTPALTSVKYLDVVPVGSLSYRIDEHFKFGVSVYPPLYSDVLYVQSSDLDRILDVIEEIPNEVAQGEPVTAVAFSIGTSVIFDDYQVKVRVNEFFGGHSAVLGNTGSGKSCTVASIMQTIFSKPEEYHARGASFLIFDTNGEYRQAFAQLALPIRRLYSLVPDSESDVLTTSCDESETIIKFRLPHWFMSFEEWELLLRASDRTQVPILRMALGFTTLFADQGGAFEKLKDHVLASAILSILQSGETVAASAGRVRGLLANYWTEKICLDEIGELLSNNYGDFDAPGNKGGQALHDLMQDFLLPDVQIPDYRNRAFKFERLGEALNLALLYEEAHGNRQIRDYCSSLLTRFGSIRDRSEYAFLRPNADDVLDREGSIELFVDTLLGADIEGRKTSQITILDMNDIEDEIVEVVSAVITRLTFERLRRLELRNSRPVNLVLEEAHRYIPERPTNYAIDASHIFERVAKEGRKYGIFIMLASQRPNELSRTVLSQCSNFIVHRIQNPDDLLHIRQMTPFISDAILRRLPALPKQHALIFGNAVNVPTTFRVNDAVPRPRSEDAQITDLWYIAESSSPTSSA